MVAVDAQNSIISPFGIGLIRLLSFSILYVVSVAIVPSAILIQSKDQREALLKSKAFRILGLAAHGRPHTAGSQRAFFPLDKGNADTGNESQ